MYIRFFIPPQLRLFDGDCISVFHLALILGRSSIVAQLLERGANAEVNSLKVWFVVVAIFNLIVLSFTVVP